MHTQEGMRSGRPPQMGVPLHAVGRPANLQADVSRETFEGEGCGIFGRLPVMGRDQAAAFLCLAYALSSFICSSVNPSHAKGKRALF